MGLKERNKNIKKWQRRGKFITMIGDYNILGDMPRVSKIIN